MARGVDGRDIFIDDTDRMAFKGCLLQLALRSDAHILAYCLMGNHFHIAIQVGSVPLAALMQRLLTGYSLAFNQRHNRTGHLFQARYKAVLCLDERYLAGLICYIHMNPVRAGLVEKSQDWPWSSLADGRATCTDDADTTPFDPWPKETVENVDLIRRAKIDRPDINDIGAAIAARTGIATSELRSNSCRRLVIAAKRLLTQEAVRSGHPLIEIARWLNSSQTSMTRYARHKVKIVVGLTPKRE